MVNQVMLVKLLTKSEGLMNGLFSTGGALGALSTAYTAESFGRLRTIQLACVVCILGAALMTGAANVAMFQVSRFIMGLGIGQVVCAGRCRLILSHFGWICLRCTHNSPSPLISSRIVNTEASWIACRIPRYCPGFRVHTYRFCWFWLLLRINIIVSVAISVCCTADPSSHSSGWKLGFA